jgi:hypothetical protein
MEAFMKTTSKATRVHAAGRAIKSGKPRALAGTGLIAKPLGHSRVLAITPDGTKILKPRGKPMSFSVSRLKRAIAAAISGD